MSINSRGGSLIAAVSAALVLGFAAPASAAGCGGEYTVQSGDTLSRIARSCDSSVSALLDANPQIRNAADLSIGWTLKVPGPGSEGNADVAADDAEGIATQDVLAIVDDGPVSLRGWIVNGRRCAMLSTPDGEEYGVISPELSFISGRPVEVEGRIVDDSSCAGSRTLLVTALTTTDL